MHPAFPVIALFAVSGPVLMLSATGLLCSVVFRKATTAAIVNFLFAVAIYVGPWLFLFTIGALFHIINDMEPVLDVPFVFNPAAMTATAANAMENAARGYRGGMRGFEFPSGNVGLGLFVTVLTGVWMTYAAAAVGALVLAAKVFRRFAARE